MSPEFVVFSAGSRYRHPRQSTVDRLVAFGVRPEDMFRTNCSDNEPGRGPTREWAYGAVRGCGRDEAGDDDVEIRPPGAETTGRKCENVC